MVTPGPFAPIVTQHVLKADDQLSSDTHGNKIPAFDDASILALAAYPGSSLETGGVARDMVMADLVLLVDPGTATTAKDEWTVGGARYRVNGEPGRYSNPLTGTAVTQVNLRRIV